MSEFRGATWSRWDLHIHTPESIVQGYGKNDEETWEQYISCLEALPEDVKVIGINDYYFIDGFEKVMYYKMHKDRLKNIDKIFPVLEFRIDTFGAASASDLAKVNLHIIFNIDEENWKKEVSLIKEQFIKMIPISKLSQHSCIPLSKDNFISQSHDRTLKGGFDNIIPSTDKVFELIKSQQWKDKVFILLGYVEWDNLDKNKQLRPVKEDLFKRANAFFTAGSLEKVPKKENILSLFGGKALLHSGDIHDFDKFTNYECHTWIKAAKTFEGLKQIIFEPEERVKIQTNNPETLESKSNVIESIRISNNNGWFGGQEIQLNSGLVSIIGEKGSGKTALLDILAITNDEGIYEKDIESPASFYSRAKSLMEETEVEVKYRNIADVKKTKIGELIVPSSSNKNGTVRYLSLRELESYCNDKEKLQNFIKGIIHSRNKEIDEYEERISSINEQIRNINARIFKLEELNKDEADIRKAIASKEFECKNHLANEPKIKSNFTPEQEAIFKGLIVDEEKANNSIQTITSENADILAFANWVKKERETMLENFKLSLQTKINSYPKIKDLILSSNITLNIAIKGSELITERYGQNQQTIESLKKELENINKSMEPLRNINKNLEEEKSTLDNWIKIKSKLLNEYDELKLKLNTIEENSKQIVELGNSRKENIHKLYDEKVFLMNKYKELKSQLENDNSVKFDVEITFNSEKFLGVEDSLINHNSGFSKTDIETNLKKNFIDIFKASLQNLEEIDIDNIYNCFAEEYFIQKIFGQNKNKLNLLKKNATFEMLYDWLFGDYLEVNYSIKYKDKPLESLSPGQKGLALMKIFLRIDDSAKPLLIDQPEDNLDNKSVYNDLVTDIKRVKKKRQVIIATHNPNLVVNTDSEQVIIATFKEDYTEAESRINYKSGALEDLDIKIHVCDILEGGDVAFEKREQRYNINSLKVLE